jgi:hypothetical protein
MTDFACKVRSKDGQVKFLKRQAHNATGCINGLCEQPFIAEILSVKPVTQLGLDKLISFTETNAY